MSTFLTFFPGLHPVQSITAFQSFKELPALKPHPVFVGSAKVTAFIKLPKKCSQFNLFYRTFQLLFTASLLRRTAKITLYRHICQIYISPLVENSCKTNHDKGFKGKNSQLTLPAEQPSHDRNSHPQIQHPSGITPCRVE